MKITGVLGAAVFFAVAILTIDAAAAPGPATLLGVQSLEGSGVMPVHCRMKRHFHGRYCKGLGKRQRCYYNYWHRCR
jgi:hypothetical protein